MGVGNFIFNNTESLYLDHEAIYGEYLPDEQKFDNLEHPDDSCIYFDDLKCELRALLPDSYDTDQDYNEGDIGQVIAENSFYQITIVDWEGYFAINVVLQVDFGFENEVHPLAKANHIKVATSFFDKIATLYPGRVRQRCCAWTSGEYIHSKAA
jgi:hypothetical protein